jgi:hypothetical protein
VDGDVGENEFRVLALKREQDFSDCLGDREHYAAATFPQPNDLARGEVHLRSSQHNALLLPHAAGPDELEEGLVIGPHGVIERRDSSSCSSRTRSSGSGRRSSSHLGSASNRAPSSLANDKSQPKHRDRRAIDGRIGDQRQRILLVLGQLAAPGDAVPAAQRDHLLRLGVVNVRQRRRFAEIFDEPREVGLGGFRVSAYCARSFQSRAAMSSISSDSRDRAIALTSAWAFSRSTASKRSAARVREIHPASSGAGDARR